MLREAARNPLWAIVSLALAPFKAGYWLIISCLTAGLVWAVFGVAAELILKHYGWTAHDGFYRAVMYGNVGLALFLLAGFADYGRDMPTHGSARFASPAETRPLMDGDGLLIGRDLNPAALCVTPAPRTC